MPLLTSACNAAIIIPPLVVVMKKGWGPEVVLNCVLCLCAWIPGVIHAWLVIARNPSRPRMTAYDEAYLD